MKFLMYIVLLSIGSSALAMEPEVELEALTEKDYEHLLEQQAPLQENYNQLKKAIKDLDPKLVKEVLKNLSDDDRRAIIGDVNNSKGISLFGLKSALKSMFVPDSVLRKTNGQYFKSPQYVSSVFFYLIPPVLSFSCIMDVLSNEGKVREVFDECYQSFNLLPRESYAEVAAAYNKSNDPNFVLNIVLAFGIWGLSIKKAFDIHDRVSDLHKLKHAELAYQLKKLENRIGLEPEN